MARDSLNDLRTRDTITIDLWIHVLTAGPTAADGYVDATDILTHVDYLQQQYAPWGFQFQVKPISYAINAVWASDIDPDLAEKQRQLRRGDYKSLNVYLVNGATYGQCTYPLDGTDPLTQDELDQDGCLVPLKSGIHAPDGTITHESMCQSSKKHFGHWLGLRHVFEGGCNQDNGSDFCDDTWPQASASYGKMGTPGDVNSCPATDSCPDQPGSDNVKNFMDYTDCSSEFTPCQGGRMAAAWTQRTTRTIAPGVLWK
ncbi:hypothetical protein BU16DRAFT_456467 [Lophium mytilinum]|uniref:Peptidase M43 pregnancy-associated plasma-A domain-containing protein n=1 Tax=Lophium mytilinum TaxID=390894 RepID=A0A6A6R012_9PEZI|nr:hypothetical protein BU16DRAFT_456467 [Lophium mytilinum]